MAVVGGIRRVLARAGARAPIPVFPVVGVDALEGAEALHLRHELRLVSSPRHATVLLVAGQIPDDCREALDRIHDQIPAPRATFRWGSRGPDQDDAANSAPWSEDPVPRLSALGRGLVTGGLPSEEPRLSDQPPHPWRGEGQHGQGGEGMMGGTPFGRPMAMTGDDVRDGLALDRLRFTVGPWFPPLPPGLTLDIVVQGDVIQEASVVRRPFAQRLPEALRRGLGEAIQSREAEGARAGLLLRRASRVLRAAGAPDLAERALRASVQAASTSPGQALAAQVRRLAALMRYGGALRAMATRAALPLVGDVPRRVTDWLEEAARALDPNSSDPAGDVPVGPFRDLRESGGAFEQDSAHADFQEQLPRVLPGLEWGEMILLLATLDNIPLQADEAAS